MPHPFDSSSDGTMSFGDHLDELRRRLILALAAPLPLAIAMFFVSPWLIELLLAPLYRVLRANNLPEQVQLLSPPEFLVAQLKLSVIAALIIASPWILWQAWKFIGPGLYRHERRFVYFLIPGSAVLTTLGVALFYFIMLPLMLQVLIMFGASLREPPRLAPTVASAPTEATVAPNSGSGTSAPTIFDVRTEPPENPQPGQVWIKMPEQELQVAVLWEDGDENAASSRVEILRIPMGRPSRVAQQYRLSEYITFVLVLVLGITIAFQMPLVIVLLGWLGLAEVTWLRRQRRYALAICAVVAAVITPADAISMIMMLIPLYLLYELGILLLAIAPASRIAGTGGNGLVRDNDAGNESSQTERFDRSAQTDDSDAARTDRSEGTFPSADEDEDASR